jgi:hypothetical protein
MIDCLDHWTSIVKIHNMTKILVIRAEEIDPQHEFYFPIIIQQRDAMDHIMRAAYASFDPERIKKSHPEISDIKDYTKRQIDKALGHMYRAFFDAADWLSILYRERIRDVMSNYSSKTIYSVLPTYNEKIVPRIEEITSNIVAIRNSKDIGRNSELVDGVDRYATQIEELSQFLYEILNSLKKLDMVEFGSVEENAN